MLRDNERARGVGRHEGGKQMLHTLRITPGCCCRLSESAPVVPQVSSALRVRVFGSAAASSSPVIAFVFPHLVSIATAQ